jgi:hypothetical protein
MLLGNVTSEAAQTPRSAEVSAADFFSVGNSVPNRHFAIMSTLLDQPRQATPRCLKPQSAAALLLPLAACLLAAFGAGCRSTDRTDPARFAAVVIRGNTPGQIRNMTLEVFKEHDFSITVPTAATMVFEKKGTKWNTVAYGDWTGSVWVRAEVSLVPVGETAFRLQCWACLVQDRGTPTEEEIKMGHPSRRPFQDMLAQVAQRLGQTP